MAPGSNYKVTLLMHVDIMRIHLIIIYTYKAVQDASTNIYTIYTKRETVHCDVLMAMSYIIMYWVSKLSSCYSMRIIIIIKKQRVIISLMKIKKH